MGCVFVLSPVFRHGKTPDRYKLDQDLYQSHLIKKKSVIPLHHIFSESNSAATRPCVEAIIAHLRLINHSI